MASNSLSTGRAPAEPLLVPQGDRLGKSPLKIQKSVVVVGCEEHCHLHLKSSTISRHHAILIHEKAGVYVRDLGSRTKVVVNGQPQRETILEDGDEIHFGRFSFKLSTTKPHNGTETGVAPAQVAVNGKTDPNPFTARTLLIGRGEECDINISSELVSSRHAIIFVVDGKRYVRDLDSRTGTFVNGKEVHQQELKIGDELKIGPTKITLSKLGGAPAAETPPKEAPAPPVAAKPQPTPAPEPEAEPDLETPEFEQPAEPLPLDETPEVETVAPEPTVQATVPAMPEEPQITVSAAPPATEEPEPLDLAPLELEPEAEPEPQPTAETATPAAEPIPVEPEPQPAKEDTALDLSIDDFNLEPEPETPPAAADAPAAAEPEINIAEPPTDLAAESVSVDLESHTAKEIDIAPPPAPAPPTPPTPQAKVEAPKPAAQSAAAPPAPVSTPPAMPKAISISAPPVIKAPSIPIPIPVPISSVSIPSVPVPPIPVPSITPKPAPTATANSITLPPLPVAPAPVEHEELPEVAVAPEPNVSHDLDISAPPAIEPPIAHAKALETPLPQQTEPEDIPQLNIAPEPDLARDIEIAAPPPLDESPLDEPAIEEPAAIEQPIAVVPIPIPAIEPKPIAPAKPVELPTAELSPAEELPELVVAHEPDVTLNLLEPTLAEIERPAAPAEPIPQAASIEQPILDQPTIEEPSVEAPAPAAPAPAPVERAPEPSFSLDIPDFSVPELSIPDLSTPDLSTPDLAVPDIAPAREPAITEPEIAEPDVGEPIIIEPQEAAAETPAPEPMELTPQEMALPDKPEPAVEPQDQTPIEPEIPEPQLTESQPIELEPEQPEFAAPAQEEPTTESEPIVEYSAPSIETAVPALDLSDAPDVADEDAGPKLDITEPASTTIDATIPALPELDSATTSDATVTPPPALDLSDAPTIAETPAVAESPTIAESPAVAEIPPASIEEAPPTTPRRRVRKPKAAPKPPTPKAKKPSRARVKRTPPPPEAIEAVAEAAGELPASVEPFATEAPTVLEPVLDQLAVDLPTPADTFTESPAEAPAPIDIPPFVHDPTSATIPAAPIEEPEIISVVAETPTTSLDIDAPLDIAPPVDIAPPIDALPIDAVPPEIAEPIELAAPFDESSPLDESASFQQAVPEELAPPIEPVLIEQPAPDAEQAPQAQDTTDRDWAPPPAAEEEITPPYTPDEPVTSVSIAPTPELHAPEPESIAPAPELVATSPDLAEQEPELYVPDPAPSSDQPQTATIEPASVNLEQPPEITFPPIAPTPQQPREVEAPMSSLGGMGVVNLDHFLGGLPSITREPINENNGFMIGGGIPVELPPLPAPPEWFGKITRDFTFKPRPAPPPSPTPSTPILDDEPVIEGLFQPGDIVTDLESPEIQEPEESPVPAAEPPAPAAETPATVASIDETPPAEAPLAEAPLAEPEPPIVLQTPAEPEPAPIAEPPIAEAPAAAPPPLPSTSAPPPPKSAAPAPRLTTGPATPPPARPKIKPPPPAFGPRSPHRAPFSTSTRGLSETDLPDAALPTGPTAASMPFDGLAMPSIREADVFSNFDSNSLHTNDAVFGGAHLAPADDFAIPESPDSAQRRAETEDHDFAEDDFWNRTDEEDDLIAKGPAPVRPATPIPDLPPEPPLPPRAASPARAAPPAHDEVENKQSEDLPEFTPAGVPPIESTEPLERAEIEALQPMPLEHEHAENDNPSEPPVADSTHEPQQADDMNRGVRQNIADAGIATLQPPPPRKKRRFRIPFLMPLIIIGLLAALGAVWFAIPIPSEVVGTLTFVNYSWTPGTQDAIEMESAQRRFLQDQVRPLAIDSLKQVHPETSAGFLDAASLYSQAISTVDFSGADQSNPPKTYLTIHYKGADKDGDRLRMFALLQGLAQANAPILDANHRLRDAAQKAQRLVDDNQKKVDDIKSDLAQVQALIDAQPTIDDLARLSARKSELERAKLDAEDSLSHDQSLVASLSAKAPTVAAATTQPAEISDPQLSQMSQQLADLSAEADSARSDQVTAAVLARQQLENAAKDFNDQISSANEVLGSGSKLRQFVDSAMDTQAKARDLINMLIVDGEDLEEQLEDTRRQVDDLIESRQAEVWAKDDQLTQLREKLQSAQHRYNANVGQGINDPRILDPIQKEIDAATAQIKDRQSQLGVDPSEIKVQESINHVIISLRNKLTREKQQIDQALDPLEKQLSDLDPLVSAMPQAQQDLARLIRQRLEDLNNARTKYAKTVGDEEISPSSKVAELQTHIADLKSRIEARKTELVTAQASARDAQHAKELVAAQARVTQDQQYLENATKALETGAAAYEDARARHASAMSAQQKKISLLDDQRTAFTDLQNARRDRDEKQSAAEHAFDVAPIAEEDVHIMPFSDPRPMYTIFVLGGGIVAIVFAAFINHAPRPEKQPANEFPEDADPLAANFPETPSDEMFR